jgi:hypothetical protein
MTDQYAPKPVTEEDVLRALINLHKRADRCMLNDRKPCGQDLELLGKTLPKQLELLRVECLVSAESDAHGDWMSDGCDLNAERDAFLYEGGAEDHAKLMTEHMAKQPKEVLPTNQHFLGSSIRF